MRLSRLFSFMGFAWIAGWIAGGLTYSPKDIGPELTYVLIAVIGALVLFTLSYVFWIAEERRAYKRERDAWQERKLREFSRYRPPES